MLIRNISYDLKKNILSLNFLIGIVAVLVMIFFTNCVVFDGETPNYSYVEFVFKTDRDFWLKNPLYSEVNMFIRGFNSQWLAYFLPVLTGIACVPMLCDELNSTNFRIVCSRCGFKNYIRSKFLSAIITATLIVIIPYIIFGIFCMIAFPDTNEYLSVLSENFPPKMVEFFKSSMSLKGYPLNNLFDTESRLVFVFGKLFMASCFSSMSCLSAMFFGAFTINKFVSMAFTVLLYFGTSQIVVNHISKSFNSNKQTGIIYILESRGRFYEGELVFEQITGLPLWVMFAYIGLSLITLYILFYITLNRKLRS